MLPHILINFKTYAESTGPRATALLSTLGEAASSHAAVRIAAAVSALDIRAAAAAAHLPIFAQHIDPKDLGASTGAIIPSLVAQAGASGTLLSHSEKKLPLEHIQHYLAAAKAAGLTTIICAETIEEVAHLATLHPDAIAIEPPELIGGNISIATAQPSLIRAAVTAAGATPLLVGAGIKTHTDVVIARQLGAQGILIASGIIKAHSPKSSLEELITAFE